MTFVLDASIVLAHVLPDDATPVAERLLSAVVREEAVVPTLWIYEVASGLQNAARRRRLTHADAALALATISALPLRAERPDPAHLMNLAHELSLSVYDSSYLALCLAEGVPLATLDARLADAARGVGISLLS